MPNVIEGYPELMKKLKRLEDPSAILKKGMDNFITDIKKDITAYAPATQANRSPGVNGYSWYVRGDGTQTTTGIKYGNSQDMANRWEFPIQETGGGVRATIKNLAKYSGYVIGKKQAWFHAKRKWVNVPDYVDNHLGQLVKTIEAEVNKELNK